MKEIISGETVLLKSPSTKTAGKKKLESICTLGTVTSNYYTEKKVIGQKRKSKNTLKRIIKKYVRLLEARKSK